MQQHVENTVVDLAATRKPKEDDSTKEQLPTPRNNRQRAMRKFRIARFFLY